MLIQSYLSDYLTFIGFKRTPFDSLSKDLSHLFSTGSDFESPVEWRESLLAAPAIEAGTRLAL
jgi:hypothetical protein